MDWFKKHVDTVIVLGGILTSVLWMNMKFSQVENDISILKIGIEQRFSNVEKEIAVIKTVLIMRNIMPSELSCKEAKECTSN